MKTKFNRFALFPIHCTDCHRYIWLEKYRRAEVYKPLVPNINNFVPRNICNECIDNYDVMDIKHQKQKCEETSKWQLKKYEETIELLNIMKNSTTEAPDKRHTLILNCSKESVKFVIDEATKIIKEAERKEEK